MFVQNITAVQPIAAEVSQTGYIAKHPVFVLVKYFFFMSHQGYVRQQQESCMMK